MEDMMEIFAMYTIQICMSITFFRAFVLLQPIKQNIKQNISGNLILLLIGIFVFYLCTSGGSVPTSRCHSDGISL